MDAAPRRFEISMLEVVLLAVGEVLKRRSRTFDSAEDLAEHYELQRLLRGEPIDWPAADLRPVHLARRRGRVS